MSLVKMKGNSLKGSRSLKLHCWNRPVVFYGVLITWFLVRSEGTVGLTIGRVDAECAGVLRGW